MATCVPFNPVNRVYHHQERAKSKRKVHFQIKVQQIGECPRCNSIKLMGLYRINWERLSILIKSIQLEIVSYFDIKAHNRTLIEIFICIGRNKLVKTVHYEDLDPV